MRPHSHWVAVIAAVATLMVVSSEISSAKIIGEFGSTYQIAEEDFTEVVRARAAQIDWSKHEDALKEKLKKFRPLDLVRLPRATKRKRFAVSMETTLEFDIKDIKGKVFFPKGYRFNPLSEFRYEKTIVVLDGTIPEQLIWFKKKFEGKANIMLLLTDGDHREITKLLKRRVFYLTKPLAERLKLRCTPSVVRQVETHMEVDEIHVPVG